MPAAHRGDPGWIELETGLEQRRRLDQQPEAVALAAGRPVDERRPEAPAVYGLALDQGDPGEFPPAAPDRRARHHAPAHPLGLPPLAPQGAAHPAPAAPPRDRKPGPHGN